MKRTLLALITILWSSLSFAQNPTSHFDTSRDEQNGSLVFKGQCTFGDLLAEQSFTWFRKPSEDYKPDTAAITVLKQLLPSYSMVIVMGTWCDDTHYLLPRLYKTLLETGFRNYTVFAVDRTKDAGGGEKQQYNIVNIPAVILFKDGKEKGRIVEAARQSIEKDLLKIMQP